MFSLLYLILSVFKEHQSLSCDSRLEISQKSPTSIANSGTGTRICVSNLKYPLNPSRIQKAVGSGASLTNWDVGVLIQNCQIWEICSNSEPQLTDFVL